MQTSREQVLYPLPVDFGCVSHLAIDERKKCGAWRAIQVISPDEMARLQAYGNVLGMPTLAAVVWEGADRFLMFHPTPDASYEIEAVYQPHLKKL